MCGVELWVKTCMLLYLKKKKINLAFWLIINYGFPFFPWYINLYVSNFWTVVFLYGCILYPELSFERIMSPSRFSSSPCFGINVILFWYFLKLILDCKTHCFRRKWSESQPRLWTWWRRRNFMLPRVDLSFYLRLILRVFYSVLVALS